MMKRAVHTNDLIKTPILINENGDISTFASIEEAERYMEPIDVERGEYSVTDADGLPLSVVVVTEEVPLFWGLSKGRVKKVRITGLLANVALSIFLLYPIVSSNTLMAQQNDQIISLRELEKRIPQQDAQEAIKENNLKFLGVCGYACSVPAIDSKDCYVSRKFVEIIPGTTDVWESDEHMQLQIVAKIYASEFNRVIKAEYDLRKIPIKCEL